MRQRSIFAALALVVTVSAGCAATPAPSAPSTEAPGKANGGAEWPPGTRSPDEVSPSSAPSPTTTVEPPTTTAKPPTTTAKPPTTTAKPPTTTVKPPTTSPPAPTTTPPSRPTIGGIEITVYYTAVESFHSGAKRAVTGCLIRECEFGNSALGSYPTSFVQAVKTEGTGRITTGTHSGRYLNWSYNVGYWIDTIPSDAYGNALVPMKSAAADLDVLRRGTRFVVLGPLTLDNGERAATSVTQWFTGAEWTITDQFTPGLGGAGHIDLYLGEEDRVDYPNTSPLYQTFINATIALVN